MKQGKDCLENQLALELDDASRRQTREERSVGAGRRCGGLQNVAEARVSQSVVGKIEVRVIEDVVEVRADSKRYAFGQAEILVDGEVGIKETRSTRLGDAAISCGTRTFCFSQIVG